MRTLKSLLVVATLFIAGQVRADITGMTTPPAGGNTQVQFNKRGAFGADANLTYSTATANLAVSTITAGKIIVTTMTVSTFSISGLKPGVMMIVGTSSQVITSAVSLSTQVTGNLSLSTQTIGSISLSTQARGQLPLSMLQSTGSFILSGGTMAYTAAFTSGTVFDTSTRTFQGGEFSGTRNDNSTMTAIGQVINGAKTDNSTTTYTGAMDLKLGNTITNSSTGALFLHSNAAAFNRIVRFSGGVTVDPLIYVPRNSDTMVLGWTDGATTSTAATISTSGFGFLKKLTLDSDSAYIRGTPSFGTVINNNADTINVLVADNSGNVTQPSQPSFLATNGTGATDVTGDATVYTVPWPTEIYDQGSNFASNTFTAPITGRYALTVTISVGGLLVTHNARAFKIVTSNRNYTNDHNFLIAESDVSMSVTCIADMDVNDTATITLDVSGSTKVVDVLGSGSLNYFSGTLIN